MILTSRFSSSPAIQVRSPSYAGTRAGVPLNLDGSVADALAAVVQQRAQRRLRLSIVADALGCLQVGR
jgi:hypothetical protein